MKIDKIIIAVLALIAILVVLLAGIGLCSFCMFANNIKTTSFNNPIEHREDKTIHDGAASVSIDVNTIGGNIEISESTTDKIEVIYDVYATQGRLYDIVTGTNYSMEGDMLKIKATAKFPDDPSTLIGIRGAHVLVKVPRNASYSLNLKTMGGNVIVPDIQGNSLKAETMGGKIDLNGVSYDSVTANTAGGNINAEYNARTAVFETMGGNIVLDAKQSAGTINANTAGGDIRVTLPQDTLFTIDASTMGGRVNHGSIHMDATEEARTKLIGPTEGGAGNLSVSLKTMGGDIEISY